MNDKEIIKLILAYGYKFDFEDFDQCKRRYTSETGFIDLWNGKRGITIGIYNPATRFVKYIRMPSLEEIEKVLME